MSPEATAVAAIVACLAWALVAAAVLWRRSPAWPPAGPRTLDLGPEPPALANFLVHEFRVTAEALPATVVDLAARNFVDIEQRGPGVFYVRMREERDEPLAAYERRAFEHLRSCAREGVVPAEALTTGPKDAAAFWRRGFELEVVNDARARGLTEDAVGGGIYYALAIGSAIPALLAALAWGYAFVLLAVPATGLLEWMRRRHPQRETPEGLEAASRWLGVRAALAENPHFQTHSPLTVELWSRLLAYAAALGVAGAASRAFPLGAESDTRVWSAYGGRWRLLRVSYPRFWPPGWGSDPRIALLTGLAGTVVLGVLVYVRGLDLVDDGPEGVLAFGALCAGVVVSSALAVAAELDLRSNVAVEGEVVRLRALGDDDKRRYYVAVDDGVSSRIRAWRVSETDYRGLSRGQVVLAAVTPRLGYVRTLVPAPYDE